MIIGLSLAIMMIITLFSILLGNTFIASPFDVAIDNDLVVNGSTGSLELASSGDFYIDSLQGALVILIVIIVVVGVLGVQILGSGLGENAQRVITICLSYGGLWGILSVLAFGLIILIQVFGGLIYIVLTLLFVIGIIQKSISNEV